MKSLQEHILEKTIRRFTNDTPEALLFVLAEAIKDCFAIARLTEEVGKLKNSRMIAPNLLEEKRGEIKSILAKYGITP